MELAAAEKLVANIQAEPDSSVSDAELQGGLAKQAQARLVVLEALTTIKDASDGRPVDRFLSETFARLTQARRVIQPPPALGLVHITDAVVGAFENITTQAEHRERINGVPFGFRRIDQVTNGMQRDDFILVAGRPAVGRRSFVANVAVNAALARMNSELPQVVLVFSLDMSRDKVARRFLQARASVDSTAIRSGWLTRADWPRLTHGAGELADLPIWIDDRFDLTTEDIRGTLRERADDVALVVINTIHLIRPSSRGDTREREICEISHALKNIARELQVPILATASMNRSLDRDFRGLPRLSDLRDSGALEEDADMVFFLNQASQVDDDGYQDIAVYLAKHASGPHGVITLSFHARSGRFHDAKPARPSDADDTQSRAAGVPPAD